MRNKVAKNIDKLVPDEIIPSAILNKENINLKRIKKSLWKSLNKIQKGKISKASNV